MRFVNKHNQIMLSEFFENANTVTGHYNSLYPFYTDTVYVLCQGYIIISIIYPYNFLNVKSPQD